MPSRASGSEGGVTVDLELWTGVGLTLLLTAYLVYALLRPERF
jgi:K+-transporting ATPase KdpF subunit